MLIHSLSKAKEVYRMGTTNEQTPEIMTVAAAAAELGLTPMTIYRWLEAGKLKSVQVEGDITLLDAASVHALKTTLGGGIQPPPRMGRG
jgi:excisionase family DNA binding protein